MCIHAKVTEKSQKHEFKLTELLVLDYNPDRFLSTYRICEIGKSGFRGIKKIDAHGSRKRGFFQFNSHISLPFPLHAVSRRAHSSYFTVAHSAARLLIAFAGCRSAFRIKRQRQKRFFFFLRVPLRFKPKGVARRIPTGRGFSAAERERAGKTANQICRLGKCCTGLGSYHAPGGKSDSHRKCISRSDLSNTLLANPSSHL